MFFKNRRKENCIMTDIFVHIDPYIFNFPQLKAYDLIIYARIANMKEKYYDTNIKELKKLTKLSIQTIYKSLNKMVDMELLAKRELTVKGNIQRTIYVASYDKNGKRNPSEIKYALDQGEKRMREHYKKNHWRT